jgi:hypothetical protein
VATLHGTRGRKARARPILTRTLGKSELVLENRTGG